MVGIIFMSSVCRMNRRNPLISRYQDNRVPSSVSFFKREGLNALSLFLEEKTSTRCKLHFFLFVRIK